MDEQIYKFLVNVVESKNPENVRFGRYYYLCGNKIFTSLNQIPEHLLIQLESPLPEIECEEHLVDGGVIDSFQIIHDKNGIHIEHYNFEPIKKGEENESGIVRSRPIRVAKHRTENPKRTATKKAVPVRKS